jgi:hypothetical protein
VVDGHMSAQKAEQIYDKKQVLQSIRDHITKLEIEQSMDEILETEISNRGSAPRTPGATRREPRSSRWKAITRTGCDNA